MSDIRPKVEGKKAKFDIWKSWINKIYDDLIYIWNFLKPSTNWLVFFKWLM